MGFTFILLIASLAVSAYAGNGCCLNPLPPNLLVEKVGVQTLYRQDTVNRVFYERCGIKSVGQCKIYRTVTYARPLYVDVYQQKSVPQPCPQDENNACCVNQPPPQTVVEKSGVQTLYRQNTVSKVYYVRCGIKSVGQCQVYKTVTQIQPYRVDVYQQRIVHQPCIKCACCEGFMNVKNVCYANHEIKTVAGHVADIKDGLKSVGNIDLKDVINTVHVVIG